MFRVKLTTGVLQGLVTNILYKCIVKVDDVCYWMVSLDLGKKLLRKKFQNYSKVRSSQYEVHKGVLIAQILPKILILMIRGHK